ncbi:MAG: WecB/TagA/CpsF family glycosyltransferase [Planctomycetales bacterium]|nr:WecB/TagA/CpsF family glycosyltransferase [Planctomycetales bacterium]
MIAASNERVSVFGIDIDRVTLDTAASRLTDWVERGDRTCRYVVTPNLDHVLLYQKNSALRQAYAKASLVVADGWPIVTASRMSGKPLPERVAGSDLVPGVFSEIERRGETRSVFLLGAAPGVADAAAAVIHSRWSNVNVIATYSPPLGFEHDPKETLKITNLINEKSPDVLVVGFGAPKQEVWLQRYHQQLNVSVALAGGATIDFLAGRQTRAPKWVRKLRLEWSHRLLTNPRRLAARYVRNAFSLPRLIIQEHLSQNASSNAGRGIFRDKKTVS